MTPPGRDAGDAMAALERLYHKQILDEDQARLAARLITGDENVVFPPPPRESAPPAPPAPRRDAPQAAEAPEAPAAATATAPDAPSSEAAAEETPPAPAGDEASRS